VLQIPRRGARSTHLVPGGVHVRGVLGAVLRVAAAAHAAVAGDAGASAGGVAGAVGVHVAGVAGAVRVPQPAAAARGGAAAAVPRPQRPRQLAPRTGRLARAQQLGVQVGGGRRESPRHLAQLFFQRHQHSGHQRPRLTQESAAL